MVFKEINGVSKTAHTWFCSTACRLSIDENSGDRYGGRVRNRLSLLVMVEKAQMGGTLRKQGKRWRRRLGDLCPPIPSELPLAFSLLLFQKMHLSKSAGTLTVVLPNPGLFSSTGCQTVCSQSPPPGQAPVALFLHVFPLWLISHAL